MNMLAAIASSQMENFYVSLEIMGFGMIGIFAVLGLIYLSVLLLIRIFPDKENA